MASGIIPNTGFTTIWINNSPNSSFSAQTVPLDLSNWNMIAILCKTSTDGTGYNITFMVTDGNTYILTVGNIATTQYFYKRGASADSTGVTFQTGNRNNSSTQGTNYCIPLAIYGVC